MAASRRAKQVWKRFMTWYGAPRIAEHFGAEPSDEWCALIDRTHPDALEEALAKVRREHLNFPPTFGQFEACIPQKRRLDGPSLPVLLVRHAVQSFRLCEHQLMRPWSYFGPEHEFTSKGGHVVKHADIAGVVIPSCEMCSNASHRVRANDLEESRAA